MANKRVPLSQRRASDARGVDVIFGGAPAAPENTEVEVGTSSEERAPQADGQRAVDPDAVDSGAAPVTPLPRPNQTPTIVETASPAQQPEVPPKPVLSKVTIYIRPEQVIAIESIQLAQRQSTGKKPDKSDLLQEAVDLLIAKYQR